MSYVQPIVSPEIENLSGLLQIRIARKSDVLVFPRILGGRIQGYITFKPGTGWVKWVVIRSTESFSASSSDTVEGVGKNQRLSFNLPSRDTDELMLDQMERDQFIIHYTDANLKSWILGTPDRPVLFRYTSGTGSTGSGRNGFDCLFYSESQHNRAEYTGRISEAAPKVLIRYNDLEGTVLATLGAGESITFDGEFDYSEIILPQLTTNAAQFATINYTKDGLPVSAQIELGKTVIVISEFTIEYTLP